MWQEKQTEYSESGRENRSGIEETNLLGTQGWGQKNIVMKELNLARVSEVESELGQKRGFGVGMGIGKIVCEEGERRFPGNVNWNSLYDVTEVTSVKMEVTCNYL